MRRIGVFARSPVAGRVKTRLSPALPPALACALHRAMVSDALATAAVARADERSLWWDGTSSEGVPSGFAIREQRGADLGARLAAAFGELTAGGPTAVIIGTDCPALDAALLERVFESLARFDLALAPATDGGYVAIGLRRSAPEIFRAIEWSTPRVLDQTRARATSAGLATRVIEPALDDLDTPADLVRHIARQCGRSPSSAPALDRALREIGLLPGG
jgi:rSAM/selenodomain-associated transferase 1